MEPHEVLAKNVRALMNTKPGLNTIKKVAAASGGRLTNGTVGRITAATNITDLGKLAELAELFEVEPWQLLVPHLDPQKLPVVASSELIKSLVASTMQTVQPIGKEPETEKNLTPAPMDKPAELGTLGPGVTTALITGKGTGNARRKSGKVQKQRSGRGPKGAA